MKMIIIASFLNRSQAYSSRELAERALSKFIVNDVRKNIHRKPDFDIKSMYVREEYSELLKAWNDWVIRDECMMGSRMWKVNIEASPVDFIFF